MRCPEIQSLLILTNGPCSLSARKTSYAKLVEPPFVFQRRVLWGASGDGEGLAAGAASAADWASTGCSPARDVNNERSMAGRPRMGPSLKLRILSPYPGGQARA